MLAAPSARHGKRPQRHRCRGPRRLPGGDVDSSGNEFRTGLDGWRSARAFSLKLARRRLWPLHLFRHVRMMLPSQVRWTRCRDGTTDV